MYRKENERGGRAGPEKEPQGQDNENQGDRRSYTVPTKGRGRKGYLDMGMKGIEVNSKCVKVLPHVPHLPKA